ncbi:MAG: hypothetical protein ACI31V_00260 [Bacilli bacterium]
MEKKYIYTNSNNLKVMNVRNLKFSNMVYSCRYLKIYNSNVSNDD